MSQTQYIEIPEPKLSRLLFADTRLAWLWLIIRVYVGWQWLEAGWSKLTDERGLWVGAQAGTAITGFFMGALKKTAAALPSGAHPDVSGWYAAFINNVALPNAHTFSYLITYGEIAVGIGLILGIFTGIAAFFGSFMNLNFLFAGTISVNPLLFVLQLFLILGWRIAGWVGVDRYLLPYLGTPWAKGKAFKN